MSGDTYEKYFLLYNQLLLSSPRAPRAEPYYEISQLYRNENYHDVSPLL